MLRRRQTRNAMNAPDALATIPDDKSLNEADQKTVRALELFLDRYRLLTTLRLVARILFCAYLEREKD